MPRIPHDLTMTLAQRIRFARQQTGLTQTELGKVLGVSYQMIKKYEQGRSHLNAIQLSNLAQALRQPVAWFLAPENPS